MHNKFLFPVTLKKFILSCFLALLTMANSSMAQYVRVQLDTLAMLDDPFIHLELMTPNPSKPVRLPPSDAEGRRFIKAFYSWRMTQDPEIVIMVASKPTGDLLYIDKNVDNDLTNDGPPVFFPFHQDTLTFEVASSSDPQQRVRLLFSRAVNYRSGVDGFSDSSKSSMVDGIGNLIPKFAKIYGNLNGDPDFKGTYGSFYFDDRVTVRRGAYVLEGKRYSLGLFDYSNNGLYNDSDDVLIVDVQGRGKMEYLNKSQVFKLNDVFSLADRNFRIHDLDKYGTWVEIEETLQAPTSFFIREQDSLIAAAARKTEINSAIWDLAGTTLGGSAVSLNDYKGKFLLLNFWGEWCDPCVEEIPDLVRSRQKFPTAQIEFISFVKVGNIDKAKKLIADMRITWPQILLGDKVAEKLRIRGFPTNILIFPNGRECLVTGAVSDSFFEMYVR